GSSRSVRHEGAPDFSDVPIDAEDPTLKAACQIDIQPTTQALATRTRRQSLDAPPNFAKGEHAEITAALVHRSHPRHDIRVGRRPYQFGDDVRVQKIIRQNSISRG